MQKMNNVNKPEAPKSPQISICARDLIRDIFSLFYLPYTLQHTINRNADCYRTPDVHPIFSLRHKNPTTNLFLIEKKERANLGHPICPLYFEFLFLFLLTFYSHTWRGCSFEIN